MKKKVFFVLFITLVFNMMCFSLLFAETKSITLPKGTTVEKLGTGHFKFKLPNGKIVEMRNFNSQTGAIGYVEVVDPDPPHIIRGEKGQFKGEKAKVIRLPSKTEYVLIDDDICWLKNSSKIPKSNYIMIDDDIVWLPVTIQFEAENIGFKGKLNK